MSSQKGNCSKSGRQKYQNTKAFRNDLYNCNKTIKALNALHVTGCCKRCTEVIEWKIKFNKYKPLTQPKKCVKCLQKSVKNSYYTICQKCIESKKICGKCGDAVSDEPEAKEVAKQQESKTKQKSSVPDEILQEEDGSDVDDYDEDDEDFRQFDSDAEDESEEEKNKTNKKTFRKDKLDNKACTLRKVTFENKGSDDGKASDEHMKNEGRTNESGAEKDSSTNDNIKDDEKEGEGSDEESGEEDVDDELTDVEEDDEDHFVNNKDDDVNDEEEEDEGQFDDEEEEGDEVDVTSSRTKDSKTSSKH